MAFTVTARHAAAPTTTAAQTRATGSTTPTADSLLLVASGAENDLHSTTQAVQAPTGGGWTYTQRALSAQVNWDTSADFAIRAAMYSAPVSGSPGAHTVTVDHYSGTEAAFYAVLCADVTGHNASSPIVQAKANASAHDGGDAETGSVTLDATPATGNLVVVSFFSGADNGGGFAAPTIGGQAMTSLHNQNGQWHQGCMYYRVITGAEASAVISCSDLGTTVGNYAAVAVEIAAASSGATVTPAVIAVTTALPAPAVSVGAAPAAVATAATLPAPAVSVGAAPAVVAATTALPAPAVSVGVAPATIAATVAMPAPTVVAGDITASPAVVALVASLPQVAVSIGTAPATLAVVGALPAPAVSVGAAPPAIALTTALPAPAVSVGVAPAVIAALVGMPAPTVDEGGENATVNPATIAATLTMPQAAVSVGAAPAVIPLTTALPAPSAQVHHTVTPATIAALVAMPSPTVSVGVAPAPIAVIILLPAPSTSTGGGSIIHGRVVAILGGVSPPPSGGPAGIIG